MSLHDLHSAGAHYLDSARTFESAAHDALSSLIATQHPDADYATVIVNLDPTHTEHRIDVYTHDDRPLNDGTLEADDDWLLLATEGVCVFEPHVTLQL